MRLATILLFSFLGIAARASEPKAQIPIQIINEHIYFELSVNGSESLNFIFDTGAAGNVMAGATAVKLGLKASGQQAVQGASGSTVIKNTSGHSMELAGLVFENIDFMLMDLDHLEDEDARLDGIIGAEILGRFVVEIDYDASFIRLYERRGFDPPAGWERQRMSLQGFGIPIVQATITLPDGETLTGPYLVDTGAATTVKFNTPFVNKHNLIKKLGNHYAYSSRTLSRTATDEMSKLPAYEVFGHRFEVFAARLSQGKNGVSAMRQVNGILGLSILKRFNTVYDYYNQVMYLKPSKYYKDKFHINHDGMKVEKENGAFKVTDVFEGSAAMEAGVLEGDIILSVDGKNDFTRHTFHDYFERVGKPVSLKVRRADRELVIVLVPRAMF